LLSVTVVIIVLTCGVM